MLQKKTVLLGHSCLMGPMDSFVLAHCYNDYHRLESSLRYLDSISSPRLAHSESLLRSAHPIVAYTSATYKEKQMSDGATFTTNVTAGPNRMGEKLALRAVSKMEGGRNEAQAVFGPILIELLMELFQMLMEKCRENNGRSFSMDKFRDNATKPSHRHRIWARRQARRELGITGRENREMVDASIAAAEETTTEELLQFESEYQTSGMLR